MGELVLRQERHGAATLILNRPDKMNALNVALFGELLAHIESIEQSTDSVGLVILRGAGRCFCAGNDLADIAAGATPPRPNYQSMIVEKLANLPQPVISAVHGACYTGGLELALAADIILASESARFADTHAKWSLTPVWGMSQRLPRRVGTYKAREMAFTAQPVDGREAERIGLANRCVADAQFDEALAKLAHDILANSWFTHRAYKKLLHDTDGMGIDDGVAHEVFRSPGRGPDMAERVAAFAARKP